MLIVRHLGTPNSSFLLASLEAYVCVIQYYSDQWRERDPEHTSKSDTSKSDASKSDASDLTRANLTKADASSSKSRT